MPCGGGGPDDCGRSGRRHQRGCDRLAAGATARTGAVLTAVTETVMREVMILGIGGVLAAIIVAGILVHFLP
jgi:hypothetical protein